MTRSTHSSKWCLTGAHCFDSTHSAHSTRSATLSSFPGSPGGGGGKTHRPRASPWDRTAPPHPPPLPPPPPRLRARRRPPWSSLPSSHPAKTGVEVSPCDQGPEYPSPARSSRPPPQSARMDPVLAVSVCPPSLTCSSRRGLGVPAARLSAKERKTYRGLGGRLGIGGGPGRRGLDEVGDGIPETHGGGSGGGQHGGQLGTLAGGGGGGRLRASWVVWWKLVPIAATLGSFGQQKSGQQRKSSGMLQLGGTDWPASWGLEVPAGSVQHVIYSVA